MLLIGTAIFGAIGAMLRFYLSQAIKWKAATAFPFATLLINVTGSAMLGLLYGLYSINGISTWIWQLVGIGLLGAYTTFSTFSYELYLLIQQKRMLTALLYMLSSILGGIVVAYGCMIVVQI